MKISKITLYSLLVLLVTFMPFQKIYAQESPTTLEMLAQGILYYDPGRICADNEQIDVDVKIKEEGIYDSGLEPGGPFILEQFAIHVLKASAAKRGEPEENFVTKQHVIALVAFAIGEGGDIANASIFNPLNLSYKSKDIKFEPWLGDGGGGEQSYGSFNEGVEANTRQMNMGYQSRLGDILSKKNSTAKDFMHALTYFDEYKGNKFWAQASLEVDQGGIGTEEYFKTRLDLIKTVKNNYEKTAGLIIGTKHEEQTKAMYQPSLLQFKDVKNDSVDDYASQEETGWCDDTDTNGTPTGTGWDLEGPNKMAVYAQNDSRWSGKQYNCGTIGACGCWVVTTAIIISTLTNKRMNPGQTLDRFGITHYPDAPAREMGLNAVNIGTNLDKAEKALRSGGLVGMYVVGGGLFTSNIHMMVLRKVSDDGKLFYVYDLWDPNSEKNNKGYTREELMGPGNLNEMYAITKRRI